MKAVDAVKGLARFGYDFVVGDDWTVAVGVVLAVALTTVLAHRGRDAWPLLVVAVATTLTWSVGRVARVARGRRSKSR